MYDLLPAWSHSKQHQQLHPSSIQKVFGKMLLLKDLFNRPNCTTSQHMISLLEHSRKHLPSTALQYMKLLLERSGQRQLRSLTVCRAFAGTLGFLLLNCFTYY